jgi:hypothetical protein
MPAPTRFAGRYVWDPAADDTDLADAVADLRLARYRRAQALLLGAAGDFGLRAHRSLVLGSAAADSDVAGQWAAETPNPDALLLVARAAMVRALRAATAGDPRATTLAKMAHRACLVAARAWPADPTPWACLLALAGAGRWVPGTGSPLDWAPLLPELTDEHAPDGVSYWDPPRGPWELFGQLIARDPVHREGHHRLLSYFFPRNGGGLSLASDVAGWLVGRVPRDSELRLLALHVLVERFREHRNESWADAVWTQQGSVAYTLDVLHAWFPRVAGYQFTPVVDLAYLAHALWMGQREEGRQVLLALGPHASRMPWEVHGDPAEQLTAARASYGLPVPS